MRDFCAFRLTILSIHPRGKQNVTNDNWGAAKERQSTIICDIFRKQQEVVFKL